MGSHGHPHSPLKKILIVGLTDNYLVRQEFEDKMEELLAKSGRASSANSASAFGKARWMRCL
jgi:hypothetical protein